MFFKHERIQKPLKQGDPTTFNNNALEEINRIIMISFYVISTESIFDSNIIFEKINEIATVAFLANWEHVFLLNPQ